MSPAYNKLNLADGTSWTIAGGDETGSILARVLTKTMRFSPAASPAFWNLTILNGMISGAKLSRPPLILNSAPASQGSTMTCFCRPVDTNIDLADQLRKLGLTLSSSVEDRGGMLVHGALAEKNGQGILLAGPSDVGKTTASRRLPPHWRSHSDDCTLVIRDQCGQYQAHPWPTWSSFLEGNHGQSWDVQECVPLHAIFLLAQSTSERVAALGKGEAACMLYETAEQAWYGLNTEYDKTTLQELRTRRFHNICELVRTIPAYTLYLSRDGAFWEQIEQVL